MNGKGPNNSKRNPDGLTLDELVDKLNNELDYGVITFEGLTQDQKDILAVEWDSVRSDPGNLVMARGALYDAELSKPEAERLNSGAIDAISDKRFKDMILRSYAESQKLPPGDVMALRLDDAIEGLSDINEIRSALYDVLGTVVDAMTDEQINDLIKVAKSDLALNLSSTPTPTPTPVPIPAPGPVAPVYPPTPIPTPSTPVPVTPTPSVPTLTSPKSPTNQELIDQVEDLLDGQLDVNASDRVIYGSGATASGKNMGGKYAPKSQLKDIVDNADLIRDGIAEYQSLKNTPRVNDSDKPLNLVFVDQTRDAEASARDSAESRRREELQKGGLFKRFLKNIWMGENGLAGALYLERYKKEALDKIRAENDIFALESDETQARVDAQLATIDRFSSEYSESIHTDAGEVRAEVSPELNIKIKDLIKHYVNGEFSDEKALLEERNRILAESDEGEQINAGAVKIDNLKAIADQVKALTEHGKCIDEVLSGLKIYSGESRANVRTEAHLGKIDKIIDRIEKSKLGTLVRPEVIGAAAAVAIGVTRFTRGSLLHAIGIMTVPGVLSGGIAALHENKRIKQERALHSREIAQGKRTIDGQKHSRRDEIDKSRYETENAKTIIDTLNNLLPDDGTEPTPKQVQQAFETIANVELRIQMSDRRKIDLIAYSDILNIELERRQIDEARAKLKVRLKNHIDKLPQDYRNDNNISDSIDINSSLLGLSSKVTEYDEDISKKDAAFKKLRNRRVRNAAAIGVVSGVGLSLAASAAAPYVADAARWATENIYAHLIGTEVPVHTGGSDTQTILDRIIHGDGSGTATEVITPSNNYVEFSLSEHGGTLELPEGYNLVPGEGGEFSITDPKGTTLIDGLTTNSDGTLINQSLELIGHSGISVADTTSVVEVPGSTVTQDVTVVEYNQIHGDQVTEVKRDFWYDNNTDSYDKNEQKLWWGGTGEGVTSDGHIQMAVSHMSEAGSSHNGEHISWSETAEKGDLKLAVSGSRGTQQQVYLIDIKPNGTIDIPDDNPARQFFTIENGEAKFNGAFAEVVEVRGEADGITHIAPMATEVGGNSIGTITTETSTTTTDVAAHYKLTPPSIEATTTIDAKDVEAIALPGFVPRRPLERIMRDVRTGYGYGYNYNNGYNQEGAFEKRWIQERSPRLKQNPDADLNTGQELKWYYDEQRRKRGRGYIKEINEYINNNESLLNINNNTKAIVCIPVAAANESDNIYRTLSFFGRQDKASKEQSIILLNVNWKQELENDPDQVAKIQKTKSEIERAKKDFPELQIATFEKVWTKDFIEAKKGKIYGEVIKVLYDTAAFAMNKAVSESKRSKDAEAILITNDADTEGMSPKYLKNYIRSLDENPKQDAFTGIIRRGISAYSDYPGYGLTCNFYANTATSMLHKQASSGGGFSTDGPNSGIRMSMYAGMGGVEDQVGAGADGVLSHRMYTVRSSDGQQTAWQKVRHRKSLPGSNRVIGKLVSGVSLDTMPDRLLGAYRQGKWIASGWDGFDDGGYESREAVARAGTIGPEDPEKDIDDIAKRIETSVSAFASRWWRNPSVIASSLRVTFGPNKPGQELYQYKWDLDKPADGAFTFKFTDKGKEELKKRMLYDRKGNKVGFGERMKHHLYDKLKSDKDPVLLS